MARLRFRNSSLEEIRLDDSNPNTHTTYHRTLSKSLRLEAHLSGYCGTRRFPSLSLPSQDPVFVQYMVFFSTGFRGRRAPGDDSGVLFLPCLRDKGRSSGVGRGESYPLSFDYILSEKSNCVL